MKVRVAAQYFAHLYYYSSNKETGLAKPVISCTLDLHSQALGWWAGETSEGSQRCKPSYKINKSWGYNAQHGNYS